ncbi:DUF3106 domain-containing protein, partial [Lysobacter sp. D1-1-M9]
GASGATAAASPPVRAQPAPHRRGRLLALLWTLLALSALALAATFWWPSSAWPFAGLRAPLDRQTVRVRPLPPAAAPASRLGPDAGLIAHRDFELMVDPAGATAARELAFLGWLAAQEAPAPQAPAPIAAAAIAMVGAVPAATVSQSAASGVLDDFGAVLPQLPSERRAELQQRAGQWHGWSEGKRAALRQRAAAWDALPAAERNTQRERYGAWRA